MSRQGDRETERLGGGIFCRSPALAGVLSAVGATLKPRVFCVLELADQVQEGRPRRRQVPERGVVEVKGVDDNADMEGPFVKLKYVVPQLFHNQPKR